MLTSNEKKRGDKLQEDLQMIHMSTSAEKYKENKKQMKQICVCNTQYFCCVLYRGGTER